MKRFPSLFLLLLAVLLPWGCTKESVRNAWTSQEASIDKFVKSMDGKETVYNHGAVRVILTPGSGETLRKDGTVSFYYAGYIFKGSAPSSGNLFITNREETANTAGWTLSGDSHFDILTIKLSEADLLTGLRRGLKGVREGEECYIVFSSQYGFGDRVVGTIPALSPLIYHIWVESISNE